ncbi:MAG: alanine racemase [Bacteroidales bacterium]|nr:alanine racemase [Bacteroidales bacterium]
MTGNIPHAELEVSRQAVLQNYNFYRSLLNPTTKLLVVAKANCYGHGAVEFARLMEQAGADYLGVATPIEGIMLRRSGIEMPVLVLTSGMEFYPEMIAYRLEPGIPNMESLERICKELQERGISNFPVHIAIDTGMHRLGFMKGEIDGLTAFLTTHPEISVQSLYSHLAAADEPEHDDFTLGQISLFTEICNKIVERIGYSPMRHILNSAGIDRFTEHQMDMVRLGLGIYGFSCKNQDKLATTAFLRAPILQIKELSAEDGTVGYGRCGRLGAEKSRIATICLGYADGLNRRLGNGNAGFSVNGQMAPTIGTICMDMSMLDITGIDANVGDTVTIFGDKPTAKELADKIGTIPYEIFTSIDSRVKRVVID